MQQDFAYYKKCNVKEMEALKEENARLKRRLEVDKQVKGKGVNNTMHARSRTLSKGMATHSTKEESEYNSTPSTKGPSITPQPLEATVNIHLLIKSLRSHPKQWKAPIVIIYLIN